MKKGILFIINDFNIGGAEIFVFRLGKALHPEYSIFIMDLYPDKAVAPIKEMFTKNHFTLLERTPQLPPFVDFLLWKINAIGVFFNTQGLYSTLKKRIQNLILKRQIKKNNIQIIHSHFYSSDYFSINNLNLKHIKRVVTIHGDYNKQVYNNLNEGDKITFLNSAREIFNKCNYITYVAEKNIEILNEILVKNKNVKKIYLGYDNDSDKASYDLYSQANNEYLTFCMVARADKSKGWEELLKAFSVINKKYPNTRLICVGPLDNIIRELKNKYSYNTNITFTGFTDNPTQYILQSNVCLLPSYFHGESLPYSIIEYLACNKPVIATNNGEIQNMLSVNEEISGVIIPLCEGEILVSELINVMEKFILNKEQLALKTKLSSIAFEKFSMKKCREQYIDIYNTLK